ncbi:MULTISPECIES: hypothetical protein [Citrobacter]|uniref:hypothetical protein n=1 Tax=Citrobacter TaxID=544 RepID=UPI0011ECA4F7|nr:hypothetical protein [Citrobacter portucalensis]KAA0542143.1 hypothetical protein F0328_16495 [Citrobacter portucalensis]MBD0806665.1 hypothetical protein [Citrobacter sp. C13]
MGNDKYFTVSRYEVDNEPKDIFFTVEDGVNEFPDTIVKLKDDIELFMRVLQRLCADDLHMYNFYYERIFILADLAFNGNITQCILAQNGIDKIKQELLYEKAPYLRSNILIKYLKITCIPLILCFLIYLGIATTQTNIYAIYISKLILVGMGACTGCWLSLAFRTRSFEFNEIIPILSDSISIYSRIIFIVIFSISLALLMKAGVIMIQLGNFNSNNIESDPILAFSAGLVMGFGEKIFMDSFQKRINDVKI